MDVYLYFQGSCRHLRDEEIIIKQRWEKINWDTLKISTRCLTAEGCFLSTAHGLSTRKERNLPPDGKVTGKPQRGAAAQSEKHLRPRKHRQRRMGGFSFSSPSPSSSRPWLTTSPPLPPPRCCISLRYHSVVRVNTLSAFLFCDLLLSAAFVPREDCWERMCSRDGTQLCQFGWLLTGCSGTKYGGTLKK